MTIALDVMGGDYAPKEAIEGVRLFLEEGAYPDTQLLLIGLPEQVEPLLASLGAPNRYSFVAAQEVIGMDEHPTKALKEKPLSSIGVGFGMLQSGKADAFIGAGNTGAMMVGAMYTVKTVEGVLRPTIASPVPREDGSFSLLLDVGTNADCKPEHLVQFAELGSLYAKLVWNVPHPRIGLLNLGEEEGKGNILAQATYPLLKDDPAIQFAGNIEGRDLFADKCDVIVCEGFVGNVVLKMAESIHQIFQGNRKINDGFLDQFNYELYGGTPILGINAPVIIGHGISSALAFSNMIKQACRLIESGFIEAVKTHFTKEEPPNEETGFLNV
ncbi:MAG: phosphate acyltransferase PlsX [Sphingobacteriales bacterium]|nr:MAG: phosphate acyltransferase PlsX [Sphingobacteriales bacterium]